MARNYQLTAAQARDYDLDAWHSLRVEADVREWADRYHVHEPVVVTTPEHKIVFALTWNGERL